MYCSRLVENTERKNYGEICTPSHNFVGLYIFATEACIDNRKNRKKLLNGNISSICTAEICWRVWGTPANFNGFRVLASLLHRRRSTEVNQTLHDVWPSPAMVGLYYMYIFGGTCTLTEFYQLQNSLCVQVLRSPILAASLHGTRAVGDSQSLRRGTRNRITELSQRARHLYSAGRLSRWAECSIVFARWP